MRLAGDGRETSGLPVACPLCGSGGGEVLDTRSPGYEWTRCACGLVYKTREPGEARTVPATLGDRDEATGEGAAYFDRYERRRHRRVAKSRRQVLDALEFAPAGRVLDVGCSLGYALEAARSLGLEPAGVDSSEHAIEACRRLGLDARRGTLTALPFEDASFAVVLLKHVFEHTPEPRAALAEIRRVLAPGGAAFFAVPNLSYFKASGAPQTSRFFRGGAAADHFVYYTPATLSRLVEEEGFRVGAVHPLLMHRRAGALRAVADAALAPLRVPARLVAEAAGLRKEFWLVAVRR